MTLIQASKKTREKLVFDNHRDDRVKQKPKYKLEQIIRSADIKKVFSKGDSKNYSYKLYTKTEVIHDNIPLCRINYLPRRYNESSFFPTKLFFDENNKVMKELNLFLKNNKKQIELTEDEINKK